MGVTHLPLYFQYLDKNTYIVKSYISYRQKAKGRHSIHSPFLYDLYNCCVVKGKKSIYQSDIENLRSELLKDKRKITINDLGAGSRVNKSSERKLSQIAKYSLKSHKEAQFLSCFTRKTNSKSIIELGSSLGLTSARVALDNPDSFIHTIEGCSNIADIALNNFSKLNATNIKLHIGNFDDILPKILKEVEADLIFIDGNHTKEATLRYFNMAIENMNPNGYIVFDDIYWSEEMTEAWKTIISNPKVSLSINLFHLGIISLSNDFSKQDFILKF
jgi:predicted O-methyltransferase YrrM